jgi:hypothetical protein
MSGSTRTYHQSVPIFLSGSMLSSTTQIHHLAQDSAYHTPSLSSRPPGTKLSCAILQGTTSDMPWIVMESNASSAFPATSASQVQDSSTSFVHRPSDMPKMCPLLLSSIVLCFGN